MMRAHIATIYDYYNFDIHIDENVCLLPRLLLLLLLFYYLRYLQCLQFGDAKWPFLNDWLAVYWRECYSSLFQLCLHMRKKNQNDHEMATFLTSRCILWYVRTGDSNFSIGLFGVGQLNFGGFTESSASPAAPTHSWFESFSCWAQTICARHCKTLTFASTIQ